MTTTMLGIYVALTIFSLTIIVAESMGLLGDDDGDSGDDGVDSEGDDGGTDGSGEHSDISHFEGLTSGATSGAGADGTASGGRQYTRTLRSGRGVFRVLFLTRMLTYFSAGFGPMGLIAILYGQPVSSSLLWATPAGMVVMLCARLILRFQQREFDSRIRDSELIGCEGDVLIAIHPGETGRVRVTFAQMTVNRYAVSVSDHIIAKGSKVRIADFRSSDLIVEPILSKETD